MPTYLEILPEDIIAIIYRHLYSSILRDMKRKPIYKNTRYFHKLLEITAEPFVCDLDYLGMLNINSVYDIFKYKKNKIEYEELFQPETAIYQRSHFTNNLEITLDNIVVSNEVLSNLYKSNKRYYKLFIKEYFDFAEHLYSGEAAGKGYASVSRRVSGSGGSGSGGSGGGGGAFVFSQHRPFACLAELLYNVIDFYNIIQKIIYTNKYLLDCIEDDGQTLTQSQRKDRYILEDMLGYHINNRFIIRFDYDIDNKTAFPILLSY
jgi:hypothetical protein